MRHALGDFLLRTLGDSLLNRRTGRYAVLIYHRVLEQPDPLFPDEIDRERFESHLVTLSKHFNVMSLSEALERSRRSDLLPRTVCITFDDGYADNAEIALPMLVSRGLNATFFISTGYLNGGVMWNDSVIHAVRSNEAEALNLRSLDLGEFATDTLTARSASISALLAKLKYRPPSERHNLAETILEIAKVEPPRDLMMTDTQVRSLYSAGMALGGHTATHPILARISEREAADEIERGRSRLHEITGERPSLFAYPNGRPNVDFRKEHVDLVRKMGFSGAVTTSWGVPRPGTDVFQIPRFTPWDRRERRFVGRLLHNASFTRAVYA